MTSDKFRATNLNKQPPISNEGDSVRDHLLRAILVGLLALTGFIHWALPIGHPMIRPGELTGGILLIPHNVLHLLFNLNGVGYFALVACVAGWIPLAARHKPMLYPIVAGYAVLTILAWLLLSDPTERGALDYVDKLIEAFIIVLALGMTQRCLGGD